MYSTIRKKKCKCGCSKYPSLGFAGYARSCAPEEVQALVTKKTQKQQRGARQRLQNKVMNLKDEKVVLAANLLKLWFSLKMYTSKKECENCRESLVHYSEKDWRGSQHHIVDKALCPSVASEPINHLVLGKWCCHHVWHQGFEAASKMPVFERAKEKFRLFVGAIAPDELKWVNPYLFQVQPAAEPSSAIDNN